MQNIYHAVIDAGSSGTRLYLYEIVAGPYPKVQLIAEVENTHMPNGMKEDGINNFIDPSNPALIEHAVPQTIEPLLNHAKTILSHLDVQPKSVVVDLFATAGMRYAERMFGLDCVNQLYGHIKTGIQDSGFQIGEIRTSDGESEEGVWTWINVNDVEQDLFNTTNTPLGVVEVGGSSAQFSFPDSEKDTNVGKTKNVSINGRDFKIRCKTILGLGQDDARKAMRVKLASSASVCFPKGFLPEHDLGDTLDGVGHYRLTQAGDYHYQNCQRAYESIIGTIHANDTLPGLDLVGFYFVGIDAVFHATKYWGIESNPNLLVEFILRHCHDSNAFPGIETNEYIQAQAANATYIHSLLFGQLGLFKTNPGRFLGALPSKVDGKTSLTWTRGYLLQKYASAA